MQRPACHKCKNTSSVLLRGIASSGGAVMVAWYCTKCQRWAQKPVTWLKHEEIAFLLEPGGHKIDDIPLLDDYRIPCDICGKLGAQAHHFLPQMLYNHPEIAQDWHKWSIFQANLCQYHHDLWHDLVTPWMAGRGNSRKIGY